MRQNDNKNSYMTHIELEISNPCNEKCIHCYRTCDSTKKGYLNVNQVKNILKQAKDLGAKSVTISGGEALLNPQWKQIVQTADELNFKISLFTNGTLLSKEDVAFLRLIKNLKEIQISLYAIDESVHDTITGTKGSCKKTLNAVSLLVENKLPVFISCPVMKENKTAVLELIRWCDDNNIQSCADLFIFRNSDYSNTNLGHRLSLEELKEFYDNTMKDNARLSYIWGKSHGKRDLNKIRFYNGASNSLCIAGDGTIYPAIGWYRPLGNIAIDSLENVFFKNPLLKEIRSINASDIVQCKNCNASDFCDFCFIPHINANQGEPYKVDMEYCRFIGFRKKMAEVRDQQLKKYKKQHGERYVI